MENNALFYHMTLCLGLIYCKTCVKLPLKNRNNKALNENGSLMKVESIAECFGAFCNTFDLHLVIIGLENQFSVILRVAILYRFYCNAMH